MDNIKEKILEALKLIVNPENEQNIVDSGLVKEVKITDNKAHITIELTGSGQALKNSLEKAVKQAIHTFVSAQIETIVSITTKIPVKQLKPQIEHVALKYVKNIIVVASGKGGVGKSTVATNLAVAVAKTGAKVGLIDADIFGPSIPKMFQLENARPEVKKIGTKDVIVPIEKYGVKVLSIGFFVDAESAVVWRGPMATSALTQFINDTEWGELDYLFIDLPPGTGDIHLTIVQTIPVTGAVIVSTPQQVAVADVIKGINMFKGEKINVPVLGIIENMAWFSPPDMPEKRYYIFGKDGNKAISEKFDIPILGQIPIVEKISTSGDSGIPVALIDDSIEGQAFVELSKTIIEQLNIRLTTMAPTKVVEINSEAGCKS